MVTSTFHGEFKTDMVILECIGRFRVILSMWFCIYWSRWDLRNRLVMCHRNLSRWIRLTNIGHDIGWYCLVNSHSQIINRIFSISTHLSLWEIFFPEIPLFLPGASPLLEYRYVHRELTLHAHFPNNLPFKSLFYEAQNPFLLIYEKWTWTYIVYYYLSRIDRWQHSLYAKQ